MNDIDTVAIRAVYTCDPRDTSAVQDADRTILALCDALDAARAGRRFAMDGWGVAGNRAYEAEAHLRGAQTMNEAILRRAEAAEARAKDFEGRYETCHASRTWAEECFRNAEARIAAALAETRRTDVSDFEIVAGVQRALTGEDK